MVTSTIPTTHRRTYWGLLRPRRDYRALRHRLQEVLTERNRFYRELVAIDAAVALPNGIPHITRKGGAPLGPILQYREKPGEGKVEFMALLPIAFFEGSPHSFHWRDRLIRLTISKNEFDALPRLDSPTTPMPRIPAGEDLLA